MTKKKSGSGLGVLAAAAAGAAAAGYYFYASKDAGKNRKIAAKWAVDLKTEVVKQAKKVKDIDQKQLGLIVATAAQKFENIKNIERRDVATAAKELKANWKEVIGEFKKTNIIAKKTVAKATSKAQKTVAKVVKTAQKKASK